MLQRVQSKRGQRRRVVRSDDAKDAAFLIQFWRADDGVELGSAAAVFCAKTH